MKNSYKFFKNDDCQYFQCHEHPNEDSFNCLFCYCPLYPLGNKCGGNFNYIGKGEAKIKDCSNCLIPHMPEHYDTITAKLGEMPPAITTPPAHI